MACKMTLEKCYDCKYSRETTIFNDGEGGLRISCPIEGDSIEIYKCPNNLEPSNKLTQADISRVIMMRRSE